MKHPAPLALATLASTMLLASAAACVTATLVASASSPEKREIMADAGGHRLRLVAAGSGPGPTVILESGIGGETASSWAWVERGASRFAPVIAYDRAGLGGSEPGPLPRDGERIASELHAALASVRMSGPYVFVGHSFGGLIARIFTERYPADVAGLVLVEPAHASSTPVTRGWMSSAPATLRMAPWGARLGLVWLGLHFVHTGADQLPEPERGRQKSFLASARHWQGAAHEWDSWGRFTSPEAAATHGFGSRPLIVLTAGESARHWGGWLERQDEIAALSSDAIHRVVEGATHGSVITDSTKADAVIAAIQEVVSAARTHRPLRDSLAR